MAVIYGINPVLEQLLADPGKLELINLPRGPLRGQLGRIARQAREMKVRLVYVDRKSLNRMAGGGAHQGVVARISEYNYATLDEVLIALKPPVRIVILDGIQDPQNLGAIVRTSVCLNVDCIIIPDRNAAGMTAAAIKASAGTAINAKVVKVKNIARTIKTLKGKNIWAVAVAADGEKDIGELDSSTSYALVFGSEGKGIRKLVREGCDISAHIPIKDESESLNVSVAVGIALYALRKK